MPAVDLTAAMPRASGLYTAAFAQLLEQARACSDGATASLNANATATSAARPAVVVSCLGMHWVNDVPVSGQPPWLQVFCWRQMLLAPSLACI